MLFSIKMITACIFLRYFCLSSIFKQSYDCNQLIIYNCIFCCNLVENTGNEIHHPVWLYTCSHSHFLVILTVVWIWYTNIQKDKAKESRLMQQMFYHYELWFTFYCYSTCFVLFVFLYGWEYYVLMREHVCLILYKKFDSIGIMSPVLVKSFY